MSVYKHALYHLDSRTERVIPPGFERSAIFKILKASVLFIVLKEE
jgi:hypothetical protein